MRFAPGRVPSNPMPAAPARPGLRPMGPAPMTGGPKPSPMAAPGTRPMGPAPMTGGGLPAPGMGGRPGLPMMKKGGKVSSASKRADGCAIKGKTKGKMV
jgi:hypothetical protein